MFGARCRTHRHQYPGLYSSADVYEGARKCEVDNHILLDIETFDVPRMSHEVEQEEEISMRLFEAVLTPMLFQTRAGDIVESVHLIATRRSRRPWRHIVEAVDDVKLSKIGAKRRNLPSLSITDAEELVESTYNLRTRDPV
jgi:hypothetical protein